MCQLQLFGVQVEPIGFCLSVKQVASDGTSQSIRVCGVYTQLVSPSRERIESHAGMPLLTL